MDIELYQTVRRVGVSKKNIKLKVKKILKLLNYPQAQLSIHFIGEHKMRSMNRKFRNKDYPTDVLTFAAMEGDVFTKIQDLGDIFVCINVIKKQAKEWEVSYKEEMYRMIIHGILHSLGYDHVTKKQAKEMFGLQEELLEKVL